MVRATRTGVTRRLLVGLAGVAALGGASGCSTGTPTPTAPTAPTTAPPTPIARLNTAQMVLHRIPFCDLVPQTAVRSALGGRATGHQSWANGDTSRFVGASGDRAQEFGCRFSSPSATAEAWVFASPVDVSLAGQVIRDATHQRGCRDVAAPGFGDPSQEQLCRLGNVVRVRHAGLFGDTWLTCQVSAALPQAQVRQRADAWCVQVANSLNSTH